MVERRRAERVRVSDHLAGRVQEVGDARIIDISLTGVLVEIEACMATDAACHFTMPMNGDQEMHVTAGSFDRGLADDAPTKLTMPYEVARDLFIERDPQSAVQAFMAGRIKLEGEVGPLLRLQLPEEDTPQSRELKDRIKAITEV